MGVRSIPCGSTLSFGNETAHTLPSPMRQTGSPPSRVNHASCRGRPGSRQSVRCCPCGRSMSPPGRRRKGLATSDAVSSRGSTVFCEAPSRRGRHPGWSRLQPVCDNRLATAISAVRAIVSGVRHTFAVTKAVADACHWVLDGDPPLELPSCIRHLASRVGRGRHGVPSERAFGERH